MERAAPRKQVLGETHGLSSVEATEAAQIEAAMGGETHPVTELGGNQVAVSTA